MPRGARIGGPVGAERLLPELERLLAEVRRGVEEAVRHPYPTSTILHRLHRDLRRLRAALSIWERLLTAADREQLQPLDDRLKRLAQLVGQVRDRDVMVELLGSVEAEARSRRDRERLDRYRARVRDDARTGRELLRAFLRSEAEAGLFVQVRANLATRVRRVPPGHARHLLGEHRTRMHERVVAAHRKARRRPSMTRLHRLRIRIRRLRQLADLAGSIDPGRNGSVNGSMRRLQQQLGRLHDLDVLLQGLDPPLETTRWGKALRAERRRQRRAIVRSLETSRPRRPTPEAPTASEGNDGHPPSH